MSEKTELSAREAVRAAYTRPDEATTLRESGAFMENALSEEEAADASQDVISC